MISVIESWMFKIVNYCSNQTSQDIQFRNILVYEGGREYVSILAEVEKGGKTYPYLSRYKYIYLYIDIITYLGESPFRNEVVQSLQYIRGVGGIMVRIGTIVSVFNYS